MVRAAVVNRYGSADQVVVAERPEPVLRAGEVLVRVAAAAVTSGDARLRGGRFPAGFGLPARLGVGFRGPRQKVLGSTFSGVVAEVAPGVTGLEPGEEVAGMTGIRLGTHAELVAVPAASVVRKPAAVDHPAAAGVLFGGTTALYFLRDRAGIRPGAAVLVNGASGAVGSSAVQLAKHFGATVTAMTSLPNAEFVTRLGADAVIDYRATPVTALPGAFDIVFDAVGNLSRPDGLRLAGPDGALILAVASLADTVRARGRVVAGMAPERAQDFAFLLQLVAEGRLDPVTTVVGGLEDLPEAYRRLDTGRKVGNLVVLPLTA
jgi:NADPH:quinone reductase-like Zn-dependent oxidoreductase